jgi:predicted  nucleic acid-binding Zn-ribbon protein
VYRVEALHDERAKNRAEREKEMSALHRPCEIRINRLQQEKDRLEEEIKQLNKKIHEVHKLYHHSSSNIYCS